MLDIKPNNNNNSKLEKKEEKIIVYNFKILDSLLVKTWFYKEIFTYYYNNLRTLSLLKDSYYKGYFNINNNDRLLRIKSSYDNKEIYKDIKTYLDYDVIFKKQSTYKVSGEVVYNISLNNTHLFLKKYYEYNMDDLKEFRLDSELFFDNQSKRYNRIDFIKKSIKIFSKLMIKKGNYNSVYNIMKYIITHFKNKKIDLYDFFLNIFNKLYIPISLYAKKVAGRKVLVPNPNNLNYLKRKLWHSARIIVKSLKARKERKLKDRLLFELLDIYNNKGVSLKKKADILKIIKENEINMRYLKSKKGK